MERPLESNFVHINISLCKMFYFSGRTPLHFCLKDDDENVQSALSLVRHGAHPHFEFCGKTPFQIAAERNIHALIEAILALPEKYDHFHSKNFFPRDVMQLF